MRSIVLWSVIIVVVLVVSFSFGSDEKGTRSLLERNGYTDIHIKGYEYFGCGKDEFFHTAFVAKNQHGVDVEGIVCKDFLKDSTIRFKD